MMISRDDPIVDVDLTKRALMRISRGFRLKRGEDLVWMRLWFRRSDGGLRPTSFSVHFRPEFADRIIEGIRKASSS